MKLKQFEPKLERTIRILNYNKLNDFFGIRTELILHFDFTLSLKQIKRKVFPKESNPKIIVHNSI